MLRMASREYRGSITLRYLWGQHFLPTHGRGVDKYKCPDAPACSARVACKQLFLEREPPVLCIALLRATESRLPDGTIVETSKDRRPVWFPEKIEFLRSGSYSLMGVIMHLGGDVGHGHYISIARLDTLGYGLFDDSKKPTRLSGPQVQSSRKIASNAYVLVYFRASLRDPHQPTGAEQTPYVRPVDSSGTPDEDASDPGLAQIVAEIVPSAAARVCAPLAGNLPMLSPESLSSADNQERKKRRRCSQEPIPPPASQPVHKQQRCDKGSASEKGVKAATSDHLSAHARLSPKCGPLWSEAEWRRFTPSSIDSRLCLGRTWNNASDGQCPKSKPSGEDLCVTCSKRLPHGRVDGPIPANKLKEFERSASRRTDSGQGKSRKARAMPKAHSTSKGDVSQDTTAAKATRSSESSAKVLSGAEDVCRASMTGSRQNVQALASSAALARAAAEDSVPHAAKRCEDRLREAERERKSAAEVQHEELEELRGRVMGRLRVLQMGIPMRVNMMTKEQLQTYYESLASANTCQEDESTRDAGPLANVGIDKGRGRGPRRDRGRR